MAYTILKSDGTILTTIADGTINTTSTSLGLPGRNFAGYGQPLDTNFVHQLENFADTTPPPNPLRGQLWYNTTNSTMYICPADGETNASEWVAITTTSSGGTTTFANVIITGTLQANSISANGSIQASDAAFTNLTVTNVANVNNANVTNANVTSLTTANITTGAPTTPGSMTGTWTMTGGAAGNTLIVNGGNLVVSSGIVANSFTFPNGTPIVPEGYNNANVNEYLQGIGNVSPLNRFQGNIYPSTVYAGNGTVSAPSYTANSDTNTGIYFPAVDTMAFTLGGNEAVRLNVGGTEVTGNANISGNVEITGTANIASAILGVASVTGNATVSSSLSVTGNATVSSSLSVTGNAFIGPSFSVAANTISLQATTPPVAPTDGTLWNTANGLYGQFSGNARYIGGQLISFYAATPSIGLSTIGVGGTIQDAGIGFSVVTTNIGNTFSQITSAFTVPVTGLYYLLALAQVLSSAEIDAVLEVRKNYAGWRNTYAAFTGNSGLPGVNGGVAINLENSGMLILTAGDVITLSFTNYGTTAGGVTFQFMATLISPT